MTPLRIGTRGSALALWQARTVGRADRSRRHGASRSWSSRPAAIGCRTRRCRRRAASGSSSRRSKTRSSAATSTSRCTARRTCRRCCPTGSTIAGGAAARRSARRAGAARGASVRGFRRRAARSWATTPAIGTGSVRRVAQLAAVLPRATFAPIRGNVDTRLRKLDDGELRRDRARRGRPAPAGLRGPDFGARSRWTSAFRRPARASSPSRSAPTTIGRARRYSSADDVRRRSSLAAERTVVNALGGGCQLPLGRDRAARRGGLTMHGVVATPDGRRAIRAPRRGIRRRSGWRLRRASSRERAAPPRARLEILR